MGKHENNEGDKSPKKGYNFRKRTRRDRQKNYKINSPHSDSDSDDSDSDWIPMKKNGDGDDETNLCEYLTEDDSSVENAESKIDSEEKNEDEMETIELQRFIQKIFPSKSGQDRLEQLEKLDKMVQKTETK